MAGPEQASSGLGEPAVLPLPPLLLPARGVLPPLLLPLPARPVTPPLPADGSSSPFLELCPPHALPNAKRSAVPNAKRAKLESGSMWALAYRLFRRDREVVDFAVPALAADCDSARGRDGHAGVTGNGLASAS